MEPEEARRRLETLGIEFSGDSFFRSLRNGDQEIVELFLDAGLSPDIRDRNGHAAVFVANLLGRTDMGRDLLRRGASPQSLLTGPVPQKDHWDKLTASSAVLSFVSSLLIAAVGGYFTYSYNQRQIDLNRTQAERDAVTKEQANRVLELEAIQKLIPTLTSADEKGKAAALVAVQELARPELATQLAVLFKGQGSVQYLTQAASSESPDTKKAAVQALSTIVGKGEGADSQLASRALSSVFEDTRRSVLRIDVREAETLSMGSGIVVSKDTVLTTRHVVGDAGVAAISIRTPDGRSIAATVLNFNEQLDLAVLRVEGLDEFVPIRLTSRGTPPGTAVIGIGYAPDSSAPSAFVGHVISNTDQGVRLTSTAGPGVAGGPVLDNTGEVIGIIAASDRSGLIAVGGDAALRYLRSIRVIPGP